MGRVVSLWRYPVKSMMGEELNASVISAAGLLGDRAFALIDSGSGKVASAKNPKKWGALFGCRAIFAGPVQPGQKLPGVWITLPDGSVLHSEQSDVGAALSQVLQQPVTFATAPVAQPTLDEYWPDIPGLANRETVTVEAMAANTFFDSGVVHLLTTSTLNRLYQLHPRGRFEVRRFRPNLVIEGGSEDSFVENDWVGRTLAIGDTLLLNVTGPCPRCVMTTLPQSDLPSDSGILRTAAQHNGANVGVYCSVVRGGTVRRGDTLAIQ